MGDRPIVEKSDAVEIPDDGRITLGEEYAHRRVPLEIGIPAENANYENHAWDFYHVDMYEADSRGRVTLPASVQEEFERVHWIVSKAAYEHGGVAEAYHAMAEE